MLLNRNTYIYSLIDCNKSFKFQSNENMEQRNVGIDRTSSQSVVTPFSASPVKKVSIPPRPSPFAKNKNDNVESVDMEMSDEDVDDKSLANPLESKYLLRCKLNAFKF